MTVEELAVEKELHDVALGNVAASGIVELAKLMVEKNNELPMYRGNFGLIPFGTAAEIGHKEMARYLYGVTSFDHLDGKEGTRLFFICLSNDLYGMTTLFDASKFVFIVLSFISKKKVLANYNIALTHDNMLLLVLVI